MTDPAGRTPAASPWELSAERGLECGVCGRDLKAASRQTKRQSGGSKRWYACLEKAGGWGSVWIVADILEKYVFDLLLAVLDASDIGEAAEEREASQMQKRQP